jgi:hypothetical protein
MPTQDGSITVASAWRAVSGKDLSHWDAEHIGWWLDQFSDRLTPERISEEIRRIAERQSKAGLPVGKLAYFDAALRELHEASKPLSDSRYTCWADGSVKALGEPEPISGMVLELAARKVLP